MTDSMQKEDFDWYMKNLSVLYAKYGHCFLVIKDKKIISTHEDFLTAYEETVKTEGQGTFIIQECVDNPDKLVQYYSRDM